MSSHAGVADALRGRARQNCPCAFRTQADDLGEPDGPAPADDVRGALFTLEGLAGIIDSVCSHGADDEGAAGPDPAGASAPAVVTAR